MHIYDGKIFEITPLQNKGYDIKELISLDMMQKVPFLEDELGQITDEQIIEFHNLFFNINDDGTVNYKKPIGKYNSKKRHFANDEE